MGRSEELLGYGPIKVVGLPAEGEQPAVVVLIFRSEDEQHTVTIALRADFVRDKYVPNIQAAAEGALNPPSASVTEAARKLALADQNFTEALDAKAQPPGPKMTRRCPRCSLEPEQDPGFQACLKRGPDVDPAEAADMGCLWGMSKA